MTAHLCESGFLDGKQHKPEPKITLMLKLI